MFKNSRIIEARLNRFVVEALLPSMHRATSTLKVSAWEAPGEPVPFEFAVTQTFSDFQIGQTWGLPWGTTWFHVTGEMPTALVTEHPNVEVLVDLGFDGAGSSVPVQYPQWNRDLGNHQPGFQAEGLAYDSSGNIIKAIEPFNRWIAIDASKSTKIDLYIEAASNANVAGAWSFKPTPLGDKETAPQVHLYRVTQMDLAVLNTEVWNLHQDIITLRGLMKQLDENTPRHSEILLALEAVVDVCEITEASSAAAEARQILRPLLQKTANASSHEVFAVGHAHIDSAWLWPIRETVRKCARTFSNVLDLMGRDPSFTFVCSSAQQLAWMKEFYPQVFSAIKKRVAEGRFIPVGGMWVESDTNMIGSEAMVRQFLYGQKFFKEEFGFTATEVWLPDSFGFSAALPQVGAGAGAKYFFSQKMSWNDTNRMPHHTFNWEGIDGTRLFSHFTPVDSYNSDLSQEDLAKTERQFAEKGASNISMVPYGWGDGGGGPTREMLAAASRANNLEGSPRVRMSTPTEFFTRAELDYQTPPVWFGEMYLEYHRGVFTSQLKTKQGNRRNEHLLREAELWCATATVRTGKRYPAEELERAWHTVLLLQFHDILPGTSIAWVHQEAERKHEQVRIDLEKLIAESLEALSGPGEIEFHFNASPRSMDGVAPFAGSSVRKPNNTSRVARDGEGFRIENEYVTIFVDAEGLIASIFDRRALRELIPAGAAANVVQIYRDLPTNWDAWDIEYHYTHNVTEIREVESIEIISGSDIGAGLRIRRSFGDSHISQDLLLLHGSDVLEITSNVDWHETHKLMKIAFAFDLQTAKAASEIQFGHIDRPIHTNTTWDAARFETCAHRWLRVAESTFGVTVANDSTYGHDVTRKQIESGKSFVQVRESILRSPVYPDPNTDQGPQVVRTSLKIGSSISDSITEGFRMNQPLRSHRGSKPVEPLITVSNDNVVVESVKLAEDGSGDLIVRLYEALGDRTVAPLTTSFTYQNVVLVDLLEQELPAQQNLKTGDSDSLELELRPFKIATLRFERLGDS
jgi:alpha-mannosidase